MWMKSSLYIVFWDEIQISQSMKLIETYAYVYMNIILSEKLWILFVRQFEHLKCFFWLPQNMCFGWEIGKLSIITHFCLEVHVRFTYV